MVTKCDLVAGFAEYFDDLTQEGRAQVWGVTFPYEQTLERRGDARRSRREFDALDRAASTRGCSRASKRSATSAAARRCLRFRSRWRRCASCSDGVRRASLRVDALRPADPAARRVLHERHAGGHADRSAARRDRPPLWCRAGGRGRIGRPGQGVLRRTAAQGGDDRRVGPRRRQPARARCRRRRCSSAPTRRWR